MSRKCEEEFNPWPSFVDIFSSVILVMLLFLLITLVNLGYYAQFKYKVSYTGSISSDDLVILNNNRSSEPNEPNTKAVTDPKGGSANADLDIQVIKEDKQQILLLEKQVTNKEFDGTVEKENEIESPGIEVADVIDTKEDIQDAIENEEYMVITYKGSEYFIDSTINRKLKKFLSKSIDKGAKIEVTTSEPLNQLSPTIAKQISLARASSIVNLITKFGYAKKDVKLNLQKEPEIDDKIEVKNGYLVIRIRK